jgi:hypothetical protein
MPPSNLRHHLLVALKQISVNQLMPTFKTTIFKSCFEVKTILVFLLDRENIVSQTGFQK